MKRLLVFIAAGAAVLLALRRPAPAPAIFASAAAPPAPSQHSRKGHPSAFTAGSTIVYVVGAVAHPGLYRVRAGARVNDAVQRAGGLRADADAAAVNLAQHVSDGDEIRVLRMGESAPAPAKRSRRKRAARTAVSAVQAPIELNAADEDALSSIPGIGPALAARIVEYRRLNGPFASLDELADVAGMTQSRIDALSAYVEVGSTP
ncbi:MAG TPA: helix-hairpin-helix domain-containing protein [Candidatus Baltobacteraceae bacterium]